MSGLQLLQDVCLPVLPICQDVMGVWSLKELGIKRQINPVRAGKYE